MALFIDRIGHSRMDDNWVTKVVGFRRIAMGSFVRRYIVTKGQVKPYLMRASYSLGDIPWTSVWGLVIPSLQPLGLHYAPR